jgi:hypothetical protein
VHPRATLQPGHKAQDVRSCTPGLCAPGVLFSRDTRLRVRVCAHKGRSSAGTRGSGGVFVDPRATLQLGHNGNSSAGTQCSGCVFLHPRATLQLGHNAQDACFCTPRRRMRVSAPQGDSVRALSSCREKAPTPPRATLQPGHGAQGMSLCTPRAFFSRDTKLRMCVCVCQGDPRATLQPGHGV